jgi:shikimate kinase
MTDQPPATNHQPSTIFVVGFMASGKTSVGRALAALTARPFVDLDQVVEARAGCTIAELIAREGEAKFREVETECLRRAAGETGAVVALGGGAFTREVNREVVSASGVSVWIDAPFELCWRRITGDATVRPLAPNEEAARRRYDERRALYSLARVRVQISEQQSPDDIARVILKALAK